MPRPDRPLIGNAAALGIALVVAVFVIVAAPDPAGDGTVTTTAPPPHPTITLDDLTADLSTALEDDPETTAVDVVSPDGEVVTVIIPPTTTTTTRPPTTTTTTSTTTTTTTVPRPPQDPGDVADSIIDDLLGQGLPVPTSIPRGPGGER